MAEEWQRLVVPLREHWPVLMLSLLVPFPLLFEVLLADLTAVRVVGLLSYVMLVAGALRSSGSFLAMGAAILVIAWTSSDPAAPGTTAPLVGVGVVVVALAADRWERREVIEETSVRSERVTWTVFGLTAATCVGFVMSQLLDLPERSMEAAAVGAFGLLVISAVVYRLGDGAFVRRALSDPTDRPGRGEGHDAPGERH